MADLDEIADTVVFPHLLPGNTNETFSTSEFNLKVLELDCLDYALLSVMVMRVRNDSDLLACIKFPLERGRKVSCQDFWMLGQRQEGREEEWHKYEA